MFDLFNPSYWGLDPSTYESIWSYLISTLFSGFVPRVIAWSSLVISIFSIVTRRFRPATAITFFVVAILMAYGSGLLRWLEIVPRGN